MTASITRTCNLGNIERREGNADRALRHYMIAVRCGFLKSEVDKENAVHYYELAVMGGNPRLFHNLGAIQSTL